VVEQFMALGRADQAEVLEVAREKTGRPTHLLEKDVWVVWLLGTLFSSPIAADLTFKGGTSLSKVYKVIDRFSEDIDLTYDIRRLIPDLIGQTPTDAWALPTNRSQASKWTRAVRERLPQWLADTVRPILATALAQQGLQARLDIAGKEGEQLQVHYPALKTGTGYVAPVVVLEFGGRATGEPHQLLPVTCDMQGHVENVAFPAALVQVMDVERTFWEKATAAHVYCAQGRIRSARYARHWHDLAAIGRSRYFAQILAPSKVALAVAQHKSFFFAEKDSAGELIDYNPAASGQLNMVPTGAARTALAEDYAHMLQDQVMVGHALPFDELMLACSEIQLRINNRQL
jgi:Nucleotidyl transferase AbiEii toxin, Type IV TA system